VPGRPPARLAPTTQATNHAMHKQTAIKQHHDVSCSFAPSRPRSTRHHATVTSLVIGASLLQLGSQARAQSTASSFAKEAESAAGEARLAANEATDASQTAQKEAAEARASANQAESHQQQARESASQAESAHKHALTSATHADLAEAEAKESAEQAKKAATEAEALLGRILLMLKEAESPTKASNREAP
jgi:hypothetical protein